MTNDTDDRAFWTRAQVCAYFGISKSTSYELQKRGLLTPVYIGSSVRFPASAVAALSHGLNDKEEPQSA